MGLMGTRVRHGRVGRTQNSTSVAETEKGGQNSTMTPKARKEGSIFYISMKSLQKKRSKIYNSKKYRGQNSAGGGGGGGGGGA